MEKKKRPLSLYVTSVIVILIIVNYIHWFLARDIGVVIFSAGFLLGMFAMYIAVHLYSWK